MMRPSPSGRFSAIVLPISLLLFSAIFRLNGLARDLRFHSDEAHYADLARRIGLWGDWQLLYYPVDKPPLFHFIGAIFLRLIGDSEFAIRLPNAFASLIMLALLFLFVRDLTGKPTTAAISVLLVSLSPMEIALASSGFGDTQMMLWIMLSLAFISRKNWMGSGLSMGLALATKPTALWMAPLVLAIGWRVDSQITRRKLWQWGRGILLLILLVTFWDISAEPYGVWNNGAGHYVPRRLIHFDEFVPRLKDWGAWGKYLFPPVIILFIPLLLIFSWKNHFSVGTTRRGCSSSKHSQKADSHIGMSLQHPKVPLEIVFGGFAVIYFLLHWLVPFNTYDRYLLPLVPMLAILIAMLISRFVVGRGQVAIFAMILLLGINPAWNAAMGKTPIASDLGVHQGIDQLAEVMNTQYAGEVFYEHWLGWELRYYLTADPKVIVVWFGSPDALVDYARTRDHLSEIGVPRYFVAPKNEAAQWIEAIERLGLKTQSVYDDGRYVIYGLTE